jgi:hypothetical protein
MDCPVEDPAILQDIDTNDDLGHHLLEISQAQAIGRVPPNAQQNH